MDANYNLQQQLQQQQQLLLQQQQVFYSQQTNVISSDQLLSQWNIQEIRDFLMIRAELDLKFMGTKRNKLLWETISTRMNELGYFRNPDQCKCKWKNLVATFKECQTVEGQGMIQQFPFYNELQSIYRMRMERMIWIEAEGGGSGSRNKMTQLYSDDEEEEDHEDEDMVADKKAAGKSKKKAKVIKGSRRKNMNANPSANTAGYNNVMKEILGDFFKKQMEMDMQWMKAMEAREEERKRRDMEWKERMESLEKERIRMERERREREEEWRMRDEARAEKRDALIDTLLNKLKREEEEDKD